MNSKNSRRTITILSITYLHIIYTMIMYDYINRNIIDNIGKTAICLYGLTLVIIIFSIIFNTVSTWKVASAITTSILCTLCIHCVNTSLIYIVSNNTELAISNMFIACIIGFIACLSLITRI